MLTAGVKLTQSGGVALLDGDRLAFNIEIQKLRNGARYSDVEELQDVSAILSAEGYKTADVDRWAIDGWDGAVDGRVSLLNAGRPLELTVAPYRETDAVPNPATPGYHGEFTLGGEARSYASYVHVASHLAAAYCTSPFAQRGEPTMVMVWDGGCFPRLYCVDADGRVEPGGEVFPLIGHTYAMASQHWGPYRRTAKSSHVDDLAVAGKMMAYIALGTPRREIQEVFAELFHEHFEADSPRVRAYREKIIGCGSTGEPSHGYVHAFLRDVHDRTTALGVSDEDVLASVHAFLEELLLERVVAKIRAWKGDEPWNLCFAGGCALNIKWNSALRSHPAIKAMWVPPFPDDSGSAVGAACLRASADGMLGPVRWGTLLGPELVRTPHVPHGWTISPCRPEELARILHRTGKAAVLLNGRAELGPRALGARSIIAPAVDPDMKKHLNDVKKREHYRPVAPICLVEHAPEIFDPGTPDPHMLFEHRVRPDWVDRIPAILHLDGTARLQTVSQDDDPNLAAVLREYHKWSGIPVLCNTSANYNGSSFFPDAASAMEWGRLDLVWAEGVLYQRAFGDTTH
ncbi:carbamoyltransferase N-terminal domain-containing protein [Streptomyces sp. DSM 42041]|uniref:Carbamoyltransferase N-terminal domain-containing protein n=1 Tax=Streptomyces hazeniae TaxID=3075538 RepID=A0ABU2NUI6_9ACTN|nr:carbamoyltransferase N-terminal domain-containing protein [Streptomyces sp. DSM 42041]MDT0379883.1 carbamoyltransferase N-terminal domain-containing protein [Streptomyces sp. DSM 42041]